MQDIHRYQKGLDCKIAKLKSSSMDDQNRQDMLAFVNECYAERLSTGRIYKLLYTIDTVEKLLGKRFKDATKEDLKEVIRKIEASPKNYTENTKKDFRVVIKKFYKFLEGNNEEYPDKVKWLKTSKKNHSDKLPEDLLTLEDVKKLIAAADNPRDKALIAVLFDSGVRVGELMSMKIKSIIFDQYGAAVTVFGKTGSRRIRLIHSCDYVRVWLENHPNRNDRESQLWVSISNECRGQEISYQCIRERLRDISKKAGISKKINPHNFRHSAASRLANKLQTSQLCIMFGWQQNSNMPSTYIHLSGRDLDDALLHAHGIKTETQQDSEECPRCHKPQLAGTSYCKDCGLPLNMKVFEEAQEERDEYDSLMSKLLEDKEVQQLFAKKLKDMK